MKRVVTLWISVALIVIGGGQLHAQLVGSTAKPGEFKKVGGAGAQFLKIGIGAREVGMGGAASTVSSGLSAVHWNPAGVADIEGISGMFATTRWIGDYTHNFIGVALPIAEGYAAEISVIHFSSGMIPVTTVVEDKGSGAFYEVSDLAVNATVAGYLSENFSFGVTMKYISQAIGGMKASGIAFDVGTLYQLHKFNDLRFAFAVSNLGPELQYQGGELLITADLVPGLKHRPVDAMMVTNPYSLPLYVRSGISLDALHSVEDHSLRVAGEFITFSDTPEQFLVGAEYSWKDLVFLRGGYRFGHDQFGLAAGLGIKYDGGDMQGAIDYAFAQTKYLGLVHWISVRVNTF